MEKKKDKESKKENTKSVPAAKPHFLEFLYKYLGLAIQVFRYAPDYVRHWVTHLQ